MKYVICLTALALAIAPSAYAQEASVNIDGVPLEIQKDDFIDRTVAIAPYVNLKNPDDIPSYGYLVKVVNRGQSRLMIQGEIINYSSAPNDLTPYMRGGEALLMKFSGTKNLACNGSICQRSHHFLINVRFDQIIEHNEDGYFTLQFRSLDGQWKPTMTVPIAHLKALVQWTP